MNVRMMPSRRPAAPRGFTLIEIMVVVAIIIILVAAVVAVGTNVRTSAMIKATNGTLVALKSAKAEYVEITQKEPSPGTGYFAEFKSIPKVWAHIQKLPPTVVGTGAVLDAWGNNITYTQASTTIAEGYFTSGGPDTGSSADDIRSTEAHQ